MAPETAIKMGQPGGPEVLLERRIQPARVADHQAGQQPAGVVGQRLAGALQPGPQHPGGPLGPGWTSEQLRRRRGPRPRRRAGRRRAAAAAAPRRPPAARAAGHATPDRCRAPGPAPTAARADSSARTVEDRRRPGRSAARPGDPSQGTRVIPDARLRRRTGRPAAHEARPAAPPRARATRAAVAMAPHARARAATATATHASAPRPIAGSRGTTGEQPPRRRQSGRHRGACPRGPTDTARPGRRARSPPRTRPAADPGPLEPLTPSPGL